MMFLLSFKKVLFLYACVENFLYLFIIFMSRNYIYICNCWAGILLNIYNSNL